MSLIVAHSFASQLRSLKSSLPHAVLLSGPEGVGLFTIAHHISDHTALIIQPMNSRDEPDENGSISAKVIRQLYEDTRSKHEQMVVLIDNAERLTAAAQGAFLKLLEEPSSNTHFLLTSHHPDQLLATIRSRVQHIPVPLLDTEQSDALVASYDHLPSERRAQLKFLGQGRPALIHRYAQDSTALDDAANIVRDARVLLAAPKRYERLLAASSYSSRERALALVDMCITLTRYSLRSQQSSEHVQRLDQLLSAFERIDHNHNPRLQLLSLVLR